MGGGHSFARVRYVLVMLKNVDHAYGPVSGRPVSIATKMPQHFHPQRLGDKCVGGWGGAGTFRACRARLRAIACRSIVEQ